MKNHSNLHSNTLKFNQVCEAFDVLYNGRLQEVPFVNRPLIVVFCEIIVETKAIYDEYGEFGLKEGIVRSDGSK